jgi:glycosyltransferase involved in cell wall biosynthesis
LKIAIIGCRGIPNHYGGFEEHAEKVALAFIAKGHKVTVYNVDEHPYQENEWKGVEIKHIFCKESRLKIAGTFIFDYLCLVDAKRSDYDVVYMLGYVPGAIFLPIIKRSLKAKLVTNMDGLEWKRSKWNFILQKFAKKTEQLGAKYSDYLISDNEGIRQYLLKEYSKDSTFIPYGATLIDSSSNKHLEKYGLTERNYFLLIARLEPENNIEIILDGYTRSSSKKVFIVVGNHNTKYGEVLKQKYQGDSRIKFLGAIYNFEELTSVRWYSDIYFHGHSVGGTNPSLLDAMGANTYIVAHNNDFNKNVLNNDGLYFSNSFEVEAIIDSTLNNDTRNECIINNRKKLIKFYNWENVAQMHIDLFSKLIEN